MTILQQAFASKGEICNEKTDDEGMDDRCARAVRAAGGDQTDISGVYGAFREEGGACGGGSLVMRGDKRGESECGRNERYYGKRD